MCLLYVLNSADLVDLEYEMKQSFRFMTWTMTDDMPKKFNNWL